MSHNLKPGMRVKLPRFLGGHEANVIEDRGGGIVGILILGYEDIVRVGGEILSVLQIEPTCGRPIRFIGHRAVWVPAIDSLTGNQYWTRTGEVEDHPWHSLLGKHGTCPEFEFLEPASEEWV